MGKFIMDFFWHFLHGFHVFVMMPCVIFVVSLSPGHGVCLAKISSRCSAMIALQVWNIN